MESYKHIELTDEEMMEAIIEGKRKKEARVAADKIKEREAANRKRLTAPTNYDIVKMLMLYRAEKKFDKRFVIDEQNEIVFELLCRYFGNDPAFISNALAAGVWNPSLEKGIFLAGNFGAGKTWMMRLFQQNQRQCYAIKPAKDIASGFRASDEPEEYLASLVPNVVNAYNDAMVFYQPHLGLCIDDIGTEDIKVNFGNKANVIGDLIEMKYNERVYGLCLHATTNLTAEELNQYYGGRVVSRMREIFNFIEFSGEDRRK